MVNVTFEKNQYSPFEIINAAIAIDNSKCQLTIKKVVFKIEQELSLSSRGHNYYRKFELNRMEVDGVPAGGQGQANLTLDL